MFDYARLESRYLQDAAFNKLVNLFRQMTEDYGFQPSELREAAFLAQWFYQVNTPTQVLRTQKEWEQIAVLHDKLQSVLVQDFPDLAKRLKRTDVRGIF